MLDTHKGHAEKVEEELKQNKEELKDSAEETVDEVAKPTGVVGRWETIEAGGDLPLKFSGIAGMSVTLYQNAEHADSLLIMYGGSTDKLSGSSLSTLFVLDTTNKDWKWEQKLFTGTNHSPPELQWHTATIIDTDIYYIFGRTHFIKWNCTNSVFAISASEVRNAAVTWTQPKIEYPDGPIPPRYAHSATAVGKKIYVFGGCDGIWYFNDISVFDTEYMRWYKIRSPAPDARIGHTATLVGDYIVVIGGYDKEKDKNFRYMNTVLLFDTRTNEWVVPAVEATDMPQGRVCHTANLMDNKIYVFGGFTSRYGVRTALQDLWYLDVSKLYDKVVSWKPVVTSGLVNPRYFHQSLHLSSLDVGQHLLLTVGGGIDPKSSWAPSQYLNQMSLLHLQDHTIVVPEKDDSSANVAEVAPLPLSPIDALPPQHHIGNELRRRNALSVQPLKWDELEWKLVIMNIVLGTCLYFVMPYILPVIWGIIKMIAFIGGLGFCMCTTTIGFYLYRYWAQVKLLSIYSTQLYDIYCETDGSLTAIATELVRGGLGPNAEERKLKTALGAK